MDSAKFEPSNALAHWVVVKDPVSWDEWRVVEAIASTGTTARAAVVLGMNQSTVFRRISQLEENLGVRLFDRDRRGFRLTTEGEAILPDLRRLRGIATDIERRVTGLDGRLAGQVRLSVNTTVVRYLLADTLTAFRTAHPEISVHLDLTDRVVNIRDREADLVIRGSNDPDPDLFGRRLMRLSYRVYASQADTSVSLPPEGILERPEAADWIKWDGPLCRTAPGRWMREHLGGITPAMTATEVETTAYLAAAGLGCALLPRFLGDRQPGIVAVSDDVPGLHTELWVLTHEDLRKTARVWTLLKFIAETVNQSTELPAD